MLDGGFEASEKCFAGLAAIEMLLQLFAEGIIELFVEVVGELGEECFAGGGALFGSCRGRARPENGFLWSSGVVILPGQFLADKEACSMETHANVSGAKSRDVSCFFVSKPFHIPQYENDAVLRRQFLNYLAQAPGLLTANSQGLRIDGTCLGKPRKFVTIGHELVQGHILPGRKFALAAAHQAAILGDFIEPDEKCAGAFKFWQVWESFHENFLHGVLGVLALPANLHAEGEDGSLQQLQSLFEGPRLILLQERHSLLDLFSHCLTR